MAICFFVLNSELKWEANLAICYYVSNPYELCSAWELCVLSGWQWLQVNDHLRVSNSMLLSVHESWCAWGAALSGRQWLQVNGHLPVSNSKLWKCRPAEWVGCNGHSIITNHLWSMSNWQCFISLKSQSHDYLGALCCMALGYVLWHYW